MAVSTEDVVWAYKLLLGRAPESDTAVRSHLRARNIEDLRQIFLRSEEFRHSYFNGLVPPASPPPARKIEFEADPATLSRLRERTALQWNRLGVDRPHHSVLTHDRFLPEKFKENERAFWESGYAEIGLIDAILGHASTSLRRLDVAVELGCGVGRVSVPLSENVGSLFCFDISRSHLELAAQRASALGRRNIEFRWSDPSSEIAFTACDFIYSCIVLQHNTPPMIHAILDAAFKALRPGGVILFQVPTYCVEYEFSIETYLRGDVNETDMEMHCLPQSAIFSLARKNGLEVKLVLEDDWTGDRNRYISNSFLLQKLA